MAAPLAEDPDHYVRSEVIRVAGGQDAPWKHHIVEGAQNAPIPRSPPRLSMFLSAMAKPALPNPNKPGPGYEREFERYLIRAALERHPQEFAAFLDSPAAQKITEDNLMLAVLALPPAEAAMRLGVSVEKNPRPLADEELAIMLQNPSAPGIWRAMEKMSATTRYGEQLAKAAARLRTRLNPEQVEPLLRPAVKTLIEAGNPEEVNEGLRLAGAFKTRELEPQVSALSPSRKSALKPNSLLCAPCANFNPAQPIFS